MALSQKLHYAIANDAAAANAAVELERERELAQSKVERLAERLRAISVNPDEV